MRLTASQATLHPVQREEVEALMAPGDLLDDLRRVPSWMAAAACRGMQSAVFFPELGTGRPYAAQRACARLSRGGAVP